ncbi:membrane protein [Kutzneria sp. 744]|nr:membrane protein [Kutzneria sp. 744]
MPEPGGSDFVCRNRNQTFRPFCGRRDRRGRRAHGGRRPRAGGPVRAAHHGGRRLDGQRADHPQRGLTRSQSWIDAQVPYSQTSAYSSQYGSYRSDCSGFVSMAWHLDKAYTTYSLPPMMTTIARSDLKPGDALYRQDSDTQHIALFVRWFDGAHTQPVVREEANFGEVAKEDSWPASWANTFTPKRYVNIVDDLPSGSSSVTAVGASGQRALFARGAGGDVVTSWQQPDTTYGPWVSLGGNIGSDVTVVGDSGSRVLFARGSNGSVFTTWQQPDTTYGSWVSLGALVTGNVTAVGDPGDRALFAEATGNDVISSWQQPDTNYHSWVSLGGHLGLTDHTKRVPDFPRSGARLPVRDDQVMRASSAHVILQPRYVSRLGVRVGSAVSRQRTGTCGSPAVHRHGGANGCGQCAPRQRIRHRRPARPGPRRPPRPRHHGGRRPARPGGARRIARRLGELPPRRRHDRGPHVLPRRAGGRRRRRRGLERHRRRSARPPAVVAAPGRVAPVRSRGPPHVRDGSARPVRPAHGRSADQWDDQQHDHGRGESGGSRWHRLCPGQQRPAAAERRLALSALARDRAGHRVRR